MRSAFLRLTSEVQRMGWTVHTRSNYDRRYCRKTYQAEEYVLRRGPGEQEVDARKETAD